MKSKIIPAITGATGIITKDLKKHLAAIPGKYSAVTKDDSYTSDITHKTYSEATV
jgi:hypothetical protein